MEFICIISLKLFFIFSLTSELTFEFSAFGSNLFSFNNFGHCSDVVQFEFLMKLLIRVRFGGNNGGLISFFGDAGGEFKLRLHKTLISLNV